MNIAGGHTEAILNKLSKPELVQIIFNTEANLGSEITKLTIEVKDLLAHSKKLEVDVAVVRNVNSKWVEKNVGTEHQCWKNVQYSKKNTLEVVGIPMSVRDNAVERKVCDCFRKLAWIYVIVTFRSVII